MTRFSLVNIWIALLLVNTLSVSVHATRDIGFHEHASTVFINGERAHDDEQKESFTPCYCPDCFYTDNSSSNAPLAILEAHSCFLIEAQEDKNHRDRYQVQGAGGTLGPSLDNVISEKGRAFFLRKVKEPQFNNSSSAMPQMPITGDELEALAEFLSSI